MSILDKINESINKSDNYEEEQKKSNDKKVYQLNEATADNTNIKEKSNKKDVREHSILDKINNAINESDNYEEEEIKSSNKVAIPLNEVKPADSKSVNEKINQQHIKEKEELENRLAYAKSVNEKNSSEIEELKLLITNYNNQIESLKLSYNEIINNLQSQINFEKEINEKYLSKLVQSNQDLQNNFKDLNESSSKKNDEILSLIDNHSKDLSDSTSKIIEEFSNNNVADNKDSGSVDIDSLKVLINDNNDEVLKLINQIKEDSVESNKALLNEVSSQKEVISGFVSPNDQINNLEQVVTDNFNQVRSVIDRNKEDHNSTSSKIFDLISDLKTDSDDINDIKNLITSNKDELNNVRNNIIDEVSNSDTGLSDDIVSKIVDSVKSSNEELISKVNNSSDLTKVEIFNSISDDLRNGNYVNLDAYRKIKEYGLFDEVFYKESYDYNLDIDPLLHFIYKGYDENKKPSKDFNPLAYKRSDENIEKSNLNPLVYFVTKGINEGNIKINDDFEEINHINKYDVEKEIENFNIRGVKKSKRKPRLIVSLTSVPEHLYDIHYTLYSLLNQKLKADKVILWLSEDEFPNGELDLPKNVLKLKQNGLSIRFCEDIKSYKKIIPVINMYPNDVIITAENDIYYPDNWLKILYEDYKTNKDVILAHKSRKISLTKDNNINSFDDWQLNDDNNASYLNIQDNAGGVLYPPNIFNENVNDSEVFSSVCDDADDIWLWAMAVLNHKKIKLVENSIDNSLTYVNPARAKNLINESSIKIDNKQNKEKDIKLKNVLEKYPEILNIIRNE